MAVRFHLLGPVAARTSGQLVDIGTARQQCVLAVLLLDANRCVSADQLIDRVWGDRQLPEGPRNAVQTYVSLLRRALAAIEELSIVRQSNGYTINIDEQLIDLHEFRMLVRKARAADGDGHAIALFEQALGLWRGEAFGTLDTPWLSNARATLYTERQAAERDLTDSQLRLGQHGPLLARLSGWAEEYPLDERLAGQLMLALFRSGRPADALRHYQQVRVQLADELGVDPSRALQGLHQQILTDDRVLTVPAAGPGPAPPEPVVPRQLPAPPRLFTGRTRELALISHAAQARERPGGAVAVCAISGGGGIGKTWLALHWAHQNLNRFPDGQLYVDLRGFDPSGEPMLPAAAIRGFLDALGVDPVSIPADQDAQGGLYRSLVAGQRMLILLDNARDAAQVIPLLPGSPACAVLVTSRQHLPGLITAHGARSLDLDLLSEAEGRELLTRHLGHARAAAEPAAVSELLACCAGLPLAISVVAARAITHPSLSLATLAAELRQASARLDALETGDLAANVRAMLSWSYHALTAENARVFGLLALAPGPDTSVLAATSLVALPAGRVRAVLRDLEHAHLLQHHVPGRSRMHDLVRLYGAERVRDDQPPDRRAAATARLVDFYLHTAQAGDRLLAPQRPPISLSEPAAGCEPHTPADPAAALAWFNAEHACLLAAQHLAWSQGWHSRVWQLAWTLNTFHRRLGLLHDQITTWRLALTAAERLDDPAVRILAHRWLGHACAQAGQDADALDHLHRSLALAERTGDAASQAHTHHILAHAWEQQSDDRQALAHSRHALRIFRTLGNPVWEAQALNATGWYHALLGNYAEANSACEAALLLHRQHQYHDGEAGTLDSLGYIAYRVRDHARALDYYGQALVLFRNRGNSYDEAVILDRIAEAHLALDQRDQARDSWRQSLELYRAQRRVADADRISQHLTALR